MKQLHQMMAFLFKSPSKIKFISKPPMFFAGRFEFGERTAISRLHMIAPNDGFSKSPSKINSKSSRSLKSEFGEPTAISRLNLIMTFEFGEPTAISRLHPMMAFLNHLPKSSLYQNLLSFFVKQFEFGEPTAISRLHLMMAFLYKSPSKIKFISKPPEFFVKHFEFGKPTAISRLHLMMAFLYKSPSKINSKSSRSLNSEFGEPTAISRLNLMMTFSKSPSKIKFISKPPEFFVGHFEFGEPTAISRLHLMMAFLNHLPKSSLYQNLLSFL